MGRITTNKKIAFTATSPISQKNDIFMQERPIKVSGCIVPGLDPHGGKKVCQDNYTYIFLKDLLLCALFDGHGPEGEIISTYCINFTNSFFPEHIAEFIKSPKEMLIKMLEECDKTLRNDPSIAHELSGSTAVVLLLTNKVIHTASLGDSRSILGTLVSKGFTLPPPANKFCRVFKIFRELKPIPLTVDQKPNHDEEFIRIREAGGMVERVTDIMGNTYGPFRVWKPNSDLPGLAMSRSIGDGLAKTLGVISTPVYHYFTLYPESDQYIIMASDGL